MDKLLYNCKIYSVDDKKSCYDFMIFNNEKIIRLGNKKEMNEIDKNQYNLIDGNGKTVLPGFIDSHIHMLWTGKSIAAIDLSEANNIKELLGLLEKGFDGKYLNAHSMDPSKLEEGRYPTLKEIEGICGDKPAYILRRDGHSAVVSRSMLPGFPGVEHMKGFEQEGGAFTGVLRGDAFEYFAKRLNTTFSHEYITDAYKRASDYLIKFGNTSVHTCEGNNKYNARDIELLLSIKDDLPIGVKINPQIFDLGKVIRLNLSSIGGCLLIDGSIGSNTAAISKPYRAGELKEGKENKGVLYYSDEVLYKFIRNANRFSIQTLFHAIGDRAIEQLLCAFEKVHKQDSVIGKRHVIIHSEMPNAEQIKRIRDLGLVLEMQPTFEYYWGGKGQLYDKFLDPVLYKLTNNYRAYLDAGITVAGGSDAYVTTPDPILGIHSAVNHPKESHRISVTEAIKMFTIEGARAAFEEKEKGSLETGKRADFVVLSDDIFNYNPAEIKNIKVERVFINGQDQNI